jgi:Transmembrane family, TMEM144 of transporters
MIVLISFSWGIFVFKEPIHSRSGACVAILSMIFGLIGMSYYGTPIQQQTSVNTFNTTYEEVVTRSEDDDDSLNDLALSNRYSDNDADLSMHVVHRSTKNPSDDDDSLNRHYESTNVDDLPTSNIDFAETLDHLTIPVESVDPVSQLHDHELIRYVDICGFPVSKRHLGMLAAAFCGLWGGSIMAPMKFCKADTKGTHYLLSFAIGSSIVNVSFWILRYVYCVVYYGSFRDAYSNLPSFHFRKMWLMGGVSGILWSIGNFFSLISVFYLGEGVGYPLVQTSILISGLWGLFYFKEVKGSDRVSKWLFSSLLTVFGILLLSYEHHVK